MDNAGFLNEVHNYIDDAYRSFEEYQKMAFEILCEFDRICRDNDIRYYLAYGTLLGAVRDGGQIPWDYDVDVQISIDDKAKMLQVLNEKLGDEFYYSYLDNTPKYPAYCIRMGKKGHHFNALHVDIFFLIGCPEEEKEQALFLKQLNRYCDKRIKKNSIYWFSRPSNKVDYIVDKCLSVKYAFISAKKLDRDEEYLISKYPYSTSKYCCSLGDDKCAYLSESYNDVSEVVINGRAFMIPEGYADILTAIYNNWEGYSPISNRFEEFYSMLQIVKERDSEVQ